MNHEILNHSLSSPFADDAVSLAAQSLAQAFNGEVFVEADDGTLHPLQPTPTRSTGIVEPEEIALETADLETADLEITDLEADEYAEQLALPLSQESEPSPSRSQPEETQILVSLNQLRQWYRAARQRGQVARLDRIAALGQVFKQVFGVDEPDQPRPFTGWSSEEIEWWLEDGTPVSLAAPLSETKSEISPEIMPETASESAIASEIELMSEPASEKRRSRPGFSYREPGEPRWSAREATFLNSEMSQNVTFRNR